MSIERVADSIETGASNFIHNPGVQHLGALAITAATWLGIAAIGVFAVKTAYESHFKT
jgi:hypothetical protein